MRPSPLLILLALSLASLAGAETPPAAPVGHYRNFAVAIYIPVAVVKHLAEPGVLESEWATISSQLKVDKVYIESERDRVLADDATIEKVKSFFVAHGVRVAGGITFSDSAGTGSIRSFCYTDPADRAFVQSATELTARHFDEIILDDFFFVTTKLDSDIAAKGSRSWTQFRLDLMNDAGRQLVVAAAKKVNPRARVIIKYPNWYEHFAGLGFDLQEGPKIFDGIYTGTETRDPNNTDQYLQQYESYEIIRYFENIAPDRNGGGWVDTYASLYVDRYAEQLWDTMFARAKEMTLFNWALLMQAARPGERDAWGGKTTSFNYDAMVKYHPEGAAAAPAAPTMARVAGYALEQADNAVGVIGRPIGIRSYRPPHATGEDFLHTYIGMIGIPVEMQPTFPDDAPVVLLTEDAKGDPAIIEHIKRHLQAGKTVVVTSGFARAMQGHGLEDIVEIETSGRHFLADGYSAGFGPDSRAPLTNKATGAAPILFPQIGFLTNDAWSLVGGMSNGVGYPLLLLDRYGHDGKFYVWTIPDDFRDLYRVPPAVITALKNTLMAGFPVRIDGPNEVALLAYDNHTFIVQSFLDEDATVRVGTLGDSNHLRDLGSSETIEGKPPAAPSGPWRRFEEPRHSFTVHLAPHSFRVFRIDP